MPEAGHARFFGATPWRMAYRKAGILTFHVRTTAVHKTDHAYFVTPVPAKTGKAGMHFSCSCRSLFLHGWTL
ncbi:hypothetical protein B4100_2165 [Heyndrickxia coagulans]|nr:hypothetical protein B4100_2165 [Heyndrickxia coagulans]